METKKVIIEKKMSGTGSILDIASEHYDIEISVPADGYAVVIPSYYNHAPYVFDTAADALEKYTQLGDDGFNNITMLDDEGNEIDVDELYNAIYN